MKVAIGQDSHKFSEDNTKPLIMGGIHITGCPGLDGNSDADVVLHALTNAISGITGVNILGSVADKMCLEEKITDSKVYLAAGLKYLKNKICHVSFSIECKRPHLEKVIPDMKKSIADLLNIDESCVGITATTGEGLTQFGKGLGVQVLCIITVD